MTSDQTGPAVRSTAGPLPAIIAPAADDLSRRRHPPPVDGRKATRRPVPDRRAAREPQPASATTWISTIAS